MIYFITQGQDYVKIGYTEQAAGKRLTQLQVGNPCKLRLTLVIEGNEGAEDSLHGMYERYHVRGEWYHLCSEIQYYIKHMASLDVRLHADRGIFEAHKLFMAHRDG